jgi:RNA polymerase sigma factor (sigma-70 family)
VSETLAWDELADRDLVARAISPSSLGERELALRAIYDRNSADVLGLCGWWLHDPDAALDAAQSTFETAIEDLTGAGPAGAPTLREPDSLGAWLHGIAKNQCRTVWRQRQRTGESPEEDLEDAEHEVTASRRRLAQVDRMLDTLAASFTERQQTIFRLVLRQGLRGQALATELGISEKDANDATYENQSLVADGFGAYILARDGRAYCEGLARVLDQAGWDGQAFTRVLRLRILRHLDNCKICDDCTTCNKQKTRLIKPYAPVTISLLVSATLHDRIYDLIHQIVTSSGSGPGGQQHPGGPEAATSTSTSPQVDEALTARQTTSPADPSAADGARHAATAPARLHPSSHPGRRPRRALRSRPAALTAITVIALAVAGITVATLTGSGGGTGGHDGSSSDGSGSRAGTHLPPGLGSGVITINDSGAPLNPKILAIAREVLTDARAHNGAALDRLLDPTDLTSAKVTALNKLLAQPGTYQQIITLLTKTHAAVQDGFGTWPGFLLAGTVGPLDAADAKVLGVTKAQDYKGININIGDAYDAKPYVPKLASIIAFPP